MTDGDPGAGSETCLFCAIVAGSIAATKLGESARAIAIADIEPGAPTHLLIVPKEHRADASVLGAGDGDGDLLADMLGLANACAVEQGIAEQGYRLVFNVGEDSGNSVADLHLHLLGGRPLSGALG